MRPASVLSLAELAGAVPFVLYGLATLALASAAAALSRRRPARHRLLAVTSGIVVAAAAAYVTWPCRMPTPWSMEAAGHLCREFPLRARRLSSGVGPLPSDLRRRSAWVRTEADLARLGSWASRRWGDVDFERTWILILFDPGARRPPRLVDLHQDWDHGATIVATVAEPLGPVGATDGGWAAFAVERASLWRDSGGVRFLLRSSDLRYHRDAPE